MQRINEDIKKGQLKKLYLLYGEEAYLRKQYRDKLKAAVIGEDTMNYFYHEGKDAAVGEIIDLSETLPFLRRKDLLCWKTAVSSKAAGSSLRSI